MTVKRSPVAISLNGGIIQTSTGSATFEPGNAAHALEQYLRLVRRLRDERSAREVHLRSRDVIAISNELSLSPEDVIGRLSDLMGATRSQRRALLAGFASGAAVLVLTTGALSVQGGAAAADISVDRDTAVAAAIAPAVQSAAAAPTVGAASVEVATPATPASPARLAPSDETSVPVDQPSSLAPARSTVSIDAASATPMAIDREALVAQDSAVAASPASQVASPTAQPAATVAQHSPAATAAPVVEDPPSEVGYVEGADGEQVAVATGGALAPPIAEVPSLEAPVELVAEATASAVPIDDGSSDIGYIEGPDGEQVAVATGTALPPPLP